MAKYSAWEKKDRARKRAKAKCEHKASWTALLRTERRLKRRQKEQRELALALQD